MLLRLILILLLNMLTVVDDDDDAGGGDDDDEEQADDDVWMGRMQCCDRSGEISQLRERSTGGSPSQELIEQLARSFS